jgi:NitT/TauT family transport system permease protein
MAYRASNWDWVANLEEKTLGVSYEWKSYNFPAPSHIMDATFEMLNIRTGFGKPLQKGWPFLPSTPQTTPLPPWYDSELISAIGISGGRLAIGFLFTVVSGALLGMLMWRVKSIDDFIGPVFLGLQTLPSVCWVPLAVLTFGFNEAGILFVLVMGSFSAAALALRDGLRTIPPLYPRAGLMLGARGWKLYRYVLLPASLPALAGSLRTGFSFAWRSLMGAELILFSTKKGLGFLLETGRNFNDIKQVVAVMIIMVVIGMLADRWVFAVLQKRVQARFGLA